MKDMKRAERRHRSLMKWKRRIKQADYRSHWSLDGYTPQDILESDIRFPRRHSEYSWLWWAKRSLLFLKETPNRESFRRKDANGWGAGYREFDGPPIQELRLEEINEIPRQTNKTPNVRKFKARVQCFFGHFIKFAQNDEDYWVSRYNKKCPLCPKKSNE